MKCEKPSPRTVINGLGRESHSNELDKSSSFGESSSIIEPPLIPVSTKKQHSVLKLFSSLFLHSFNNNARKNKGAMSNGKSHQSSLRCFSFNDISMATNNFHPDNLVGLGGYSEVYKGDLYYGHAIAVKKLGKKSTEKEFLTELGILGHVSHPNTANLIGFCIENGLHLIFTFCPNGSLCSALHGRMCDSLEWSVRYKVAVGVARGLNYLHKCCKHRIIHRDIKASNVLLGPDYEPQITDFGLAKWLPNKWTHHAVIPVEGTFGYLAPEYFMHGIVDEKIDVFSFGILLLEILSGRRPVDSSKKNLLHWAKPIMESGNFAELADSKLGGKYDKDEMHRLVLTASYCVRQSSIWRPSMAEVLELLTTGYDLGNVRGYRRYESMLMMTKDFYMEMENVSTDIA